MPLTLTYQPQHLAIKNVILKNLKIPPNDPETKHIFSLPPLTSFKSDKNIGYVLVRSATNQDPSHVNAYDAKLVPLFLTLLRSKAGPNQSTKVTDHFTCISVNVIYCITCTLCKKIYRSETGRRSADRFREHLRDIKKKNHTDASKPVAHHFNLPYPSHHYMTICRLSLNHGNTESNKSLKQNFIFQLGTLTLSTRD